ncbi:MAG: FadR family transcriptional regulator, partial [Actinomycetota bacterium]|nr:FadR family transcriptional regulator [Actinomycetota bacterium]
MVDGGERGGQVFRPISPGRISELIVDQMRQLILNGQLSTGDRLPPERELAERFGVSRVTVRDALRTLEAQGLLEIRVGASGGAFVTAPSTMVVGKGIANMLLLSVLGPEEVAEARLVMELGTVALAVRRATDTDLERLREICRRSEAAHGNGEYDVELSSEFHVTLAEAAHNGAINMITESFRGPLRMAAVRAREPAEQSHERSITEHVALVDAIAARDVVAARQIMTAHLARGTA